MKRIDLNLENEYLVQDKKTPPSQSTESTSAQYMTVPMVEETPVDSDAPVEGYVIHRENDSVPVADSSGSTPVKPDDKKPVVSSESDKKSDDDTEESEDKKEVKVDTSFSKLKDITNPLNDSYNDLSAIKAQFYSDGSEIKLPQLVELDNFIDAFESVDGGEDENDKTADFMGDELPQGFHSVGQAYASASKSNTESSTDISASTFNTYRSKNGKFSIAFGGAYEYSKTVSQPDVDDVDSDGTLNPDATVGNDAEERTIPLSRVASEIIGELSSEDDTPMPTVDSNKETERTVNAFVMGKYDFGKYVTAAGGNVSSFDGNTRFTINAGVLHKDSGIAGTFRRQILVMKDPVTGERITKNITNVKLTVVDTVKKVEVTSEDDEKVDNAVVAEENMPKEESPENNELVASDNNEFETRYGFGVDLELDANPESDQYGAMFKYSAALLKNSKNSDAVITPFVGLYDVHPNKNEAFKVSAGVLGQYSTKIHNNTMFDLTAYVVNHRTMQHGNSPMNTFMAVVDGSLTNKDWDVSLDGGYINTNNTIKLAYVSCGIEYRMKNSSVRLGAGFSHTNSFGDIENERHIGVSYKYRF